MGVLKQIYDVIQGYRAAGKTEREIFEAIEAAAEKATVKIKKTEQIRNEQLERKSKTLKEALSEYGISAEDAKRAFEAMNQKTKREIRQPTNNWRKMHGLPVRRRKRHDRGRKADNDSKDADVS